MSKPIIGISGSVIIDDGGIFPGYHRSYVNEDYVDSVVQNGGVPYIIPFTEDDEVIREQLNHVQGLILSGGHDVDPHGYGEEPLQKLAQLGQSVITLICACLNWPKKMEFRFLVFVVALKSLTLRTAARFIKIFLTAKN